MDNNAMVLHPSSLGSLNQVLAHAMKPDQLLEVAGCHYTSEDELIENQYETNKENENKLNTRQSNFMVQHNQADKICDDINEVENLPSKNWRSEAYAQLLHFEQRRIIRQGTQQNHTLVPQEACFDKFELGNEEKRNLKLCVETIRNGSFLHRYFCTEPWLKQLYIILIQQMNNNKIQDNEQHHEQANQALIRPVEPEQLDQQISEHQEINPEIQLVDDTQTENSVEINDDIADQEQSQVLEQKQVGQKRTLSNLISINDLASKSVSVAPQQQKKRGRKAMDKEQLRKNMEVKIAQMQAQYDRANEDGLTSLQKLKLRNHIQAQKSRMRKYDQKAKQDREILSQNQKAIIFMKILEEELGQNDKDKVYTSLRMNKRISGSHQDNESQHQVLKMQKTKSNESNNFTKLLENILIPQNNDPVYI